MGERVSGAYEKEKGGWRNLGDRFEQKGRLLIDEEGRFPGWDETLLGDASAQS